MELEVGKECMTKSGLEVKVIYKLDGDSTYQYICVIRCEDNTERYDTYDMYGGNGDNLELDLVEKPKEYWINLYNSDTITTGTFLYETREEAESVSKDNHYYKTIKIEGV